MAGLTLAACGGPAVPTARQPGFPATDPTGTSQPADAPSGVPEASPVPTTVWPTLSRDPAAVATVLTDGERTIADATTTVAERATAGVRTQAAYRLLVDDPDLADAVLGMVPDDVRPAVDANLGAARALRSMHRRFADTLPAWRIVEPPPAEVLRGLYGRAEAETGVPWPVLAAIHLIETRMGRIRGTSVAGARGPMQFLPSTWEAYGDGGDIEDPADAIRAAARYLVAHGAPGDLASAVFAYNRHEAYVAAVLAYAGVMAANPAAYDAYHAWQVIYRTTIGDVWLCVGYDQPEPVPATIPAPGCPA